MNSKIMDHTAHAVKITQGQCLCCVQELLPWRQVLRTAAENPIVHELQVPWRLQAWAHGLELVVVELFEAIPVLRLQVFVALSKVFLLLGDLLGRAKVPSDADAATVQSQTAFANAEASSI